MSNIIFCTLSIGINYTRDYTIQLIEEVLSKTSSRIAITTDEPDIITSKFGYNPRILIEYFDRTKYKIRLPIGPLTNGITHASDFNFNLKYTVLHQLLDVPEKYVFFMDCDDQIVDWNDSEVESVLEQQYSSGITFWAHRCVKDHIGTVLANYISNLSLSNPAPTLGWHKVWAYDMIHHHRPSWDGAAFPAEHFMILVNEGNKIQTMYTQWKWFHDTLCSLPYTWGTWAEGLEIGISAHVAGYVVSPIPTNICSMFVASGHKEGFHHATDH